MLLVLEAAAFALAALVHFGVLATGFEDQAAGTAESIIGIVLIAGAGIATAQPGWTRPIAIAVQGFALLGSLIGLTLAITVGPTTIPDLVFHAGIVIVLAWGLVSTWRTGSGAATA